MRQRFDWFGRCAGWHAAAMRGRYVTDAEARAGDRSMGTPDSKPIAEIMEEARATIAFGRIVMCQRRADGLRRCSLITREAATELVLDLQMALAQ